MESCTSGIVCTTSYESYALNLLFSHLPRTGLSSPCLLPPLLAFLFSLPTLSHAGVSNKAGYPSPLNGIIWGWEMWSESWDCRCSLLSSFRLLPGFFPLGGNFHPTGRDWSKWARGNTRVGTREERLGRICLCKDCVSCLPSCFSHNTQCLAGKTARNEGRLCQLLGCLLPCICVLSSFLVLSLNLWTR